MINSRSAAWILIFSAVFIWSAVNPRDYFTWMLEVSPAVIALILLTMTWRRFPLTGLAYVLILLHAIILMIGGHYTYAEVPLFDGLLGMERNNYDKVGHLAQGFIPAIVAREVLVRHHVVKGSGWLFLFVVSFCLGFSAFYELIEWWVALLSDTAAEAFLGTQGYQWDTQSDMGFALAGAVLALLLLSSWHDRQIAALEDKHRN
jgi:putative membrane protein